VSESERLSFEEHLEKYELDAGDPSPDRVCPQCQRAGMVRVKPRRESFTWWDDPAAYLLCPACLGVAE